MKQQEQAPKPQQQKKRRPNKRRSGKPASCTETKRAIRTVERLLRKPDLPEHVREAQGRKLGQLKEQLVEQSAAFRTKELEIKMSTKYRKVKFFERQKITRKLDQIAKKEQTGEGDPEDLAAERLRWQRDLFYISNYPKTEPYISLFLSAEKDTEEVRQKRQEVRDKIDAAAANKTKSKHAVDLEEEEHIQEVEDDFFVAAPEASEDDEPQPVEKPKKRSGTPDTGKKKKKTKKSRNSEAE
eukprot:TRINITY_DN30924_c0_g1_i7.p1 TRINITY_DN30924_c0_g1~~TRINITY_DN30924_c0_g1_i7.p1  ORF type:complete len:241 (-),score=77.44 TRINITY_DN30924_c0_g1_i7:130-852(-)